MNLMDDSFEEMSLPAAQITDDHSAAAHPVAVAADAASPVQMQIPSPSPTPVIHSSYQIQHYPPSLQQSHHVRCPSPLKQVSSYSFASSVGAGPLPSSQSDAVINLMDADTSVVQAQESSSAEMAKPGRRWGVIAKMRAEKSTASNADPEYVVNALEEDDDPQHLQADQSTAFFGPTDCSMILDEEGSFLFADMTLNNSNTLPLPPASSGAHPTILPKSSSSSLTVYQPPVALPSQHATFSSNPQQHDPSHDFGGSVSRTSHSILPASLTSSTRHALASSTSTVLASSIHRSTNAHDEDGNVSLLNASTSSYREYRDSPVRPRLVSIQAERGIACNRNKRDVSSPLRGIGASEPLNDISESGNGSRESGGDTLGDVGSFLRNWKGEDTVTALLDQNPPTQPINGESTLTFEFDLAAPLLPTILPQPAPTSTSAASSRSVSTPLSLSVRRSPGSNGSFKNDVGKSSSSIESSLGNVLDATPPTKETIVDLLIWDTVAKPKAGRRESTVAMLNKRAEDITRRRSMQSAAIMDDLSTRSPSTSTSTFYSIAPLSARRRQSMANTPIFSRTARPALSIPSPAPSSSLLNATPVRQRSTISSRSSVLHRSDSFESFDEGNTVIFGANHDRNHHDFADFAMTPAIVRRIIPRTSMGARLMTPLKSITTTTVSKNGGRGRGMREDITARIFQKENDSASIRKETTRERLDRARDDRLRRESARSPDKVSAVLTAARSASIAPSLAARKLASPSSRTRTSRPLSSTSIIAPTSTSTSGGLQRPGSLLTRPKYAVAPSSTSTTCRTSLLGPSSSGIARSSSLTGISRVPTTSRSSTARSPMRSDPTASRLMAIPRSTASSPRTRSDRVPLSSTVATVAPTGIRRPAVAIGPRAKLLERSSEVLPAPAATRFGAISSRASAIALGR